MLKKRSMEELMARPVARDEIAMDGRGGGTVVMPRSKVDNNPGMQNLMNTGRTTGAQMAQDAEAERRNFMSGMKRRVGNNAVNMGMYERHARNTGALPAARQRQEAGNMTMDDALALGLRQSRYSDNGMQSETYQDQDKFGRPWERTRQVERSPDQWLEQMFNAPQRERMAGRETQRNQILQQAFSNPNLQPTTTIFGEDGKLNKDLNFMATPQPEKYISTPAGTLRGSDEQIVPGTEPALESVQQYGEGPQGPVVQQNGFVGVWDPKLGQYSGWKPMEQGVDLEAMEPQMRAVMVAIGKGASFDYSKVPKLGAAAAVMPDEPGAAPAALDSDSIAAAYKAGTMTYEEAEARLRELGLVQ